MSEVETTAEEKKTVRDVVEFRGHPMVRATHPTTIEVTTEDYLTESGDCIIGVGASKGCAGLNDEIRGAIRREAAEVTITIVVGGLRHLVRAEGGPDLELSDPHEIVVRKSGFVSGRTLAVRSDSGSRNIPREMVRMLKSTVTKGRLEIEVRR